MSCFFSLALINRPTSEIFSACFVTRISLNEKGSEVMFFVITEMNKGKLSDKTKRKISKNRKGISVGANNHFYGKHHSDKTRKRIGNSRKGKSLGHIGYMTGKTHTREWKEEATSTSARMGSISISAGGYLESTSSLP